MFTLLSLLLTLLIQESNEAFDVLETALQSHPYFRIQAAGMQTPSTSPLAAAAVLSNSASRAASISSESVPDIPAAADEDPDTDNNAADPADTAGTAAATDAVLAASSAPVAAATQLAAAAAAAGGASGAASKSSNGPIVSLSAMLSAVRKDRSSFMDKVNEVVQRATPVTPAWEENTGRDLTAVLCR